MTTGNGMTDRFCVDGSTGIDPMKVYQELVLTRLVLGALVSRLDAVHRDPRYIEVWSNYRQYAEYVGPFYRDELDKARQILKRTA